MAWLCLRPGCKARVSMQEARAKPGVPLDMLWDERMAAPAPPRKPEGDIMAIRADIKQGRGRTAETGAGKP